MTRHRGHAGYRRHQRYRTRDEWRAIWAKKGKAITTQSRPGVFSFESPGAAREACRTLRRRFDAAPPHDKIRIAVLTSQAAGASRAAGLAAVGQIYGDEARRMWRQTSEER